MQVQDLVDIRYAVVNDVVGNRCIRMVYGTDSLAFAWPSFGNDVRFPGSTLCSLVDIKSNINQNVFQINKLNDMSMTPSIMKCVR